MIKNIIFDFDGVIGDSEVLVAKAFSKYLLKSGIIFEEKEFASYAGKKTIEIINIISNKFNIENQQKFFDDIMNIADDIYSKELTCVIGVEKFLQKTNFNFYIGSNSVKKRILIGLKKIQLISFFPEKNIFTFDMVKIAKPEPDIYLNVIDSHKLNKEETIIIEDSAVGVKAGVAAGIKVIGLTAGGHWYPSRSTKELKEAGAYIIFDNYEKILKEINNYE